MDNQSKKPAGYGSIKNRKLTGSHYTPSKLSDFVANQIIKEWDKKQSTVKIIDPAIGDGELLSSLTSLILNLNSNVRIKVNGFDIDQNAIEVAKIRMNSFGNKISLNIRREDFLNYSLLYRNDLLLNKKVVDVYDLIIANPPYVRTQVLGSERSKNLAKQFGLTGRVDLYHAFILGIVNILSKDGIVGIIVSNRFMTTKSGEMIRKNILDYFDIIQVWDFGDTQLFEAAVLPAVLLLRKKGNNTNIKKTKFTSIYSTKENIVEKIKTVNNIFEDLEKDGLIKFNNKVYKIQTGVLNHGDSNIDVWRISNGNFDKWLKKVDENTHFHFSDIGKIKVGVKTTADNVFIRSDWDSFSDKEKPELLKPLLTHHVAKRYRIDPKTISRKILYPHTAINGKRVVENLIEHPKSQLYLNKHKTQLENRKYVIQAGRKWYEIWVPHDPLLWAKPKIVFKDISEKPCFWLDTSGAIINGDCYWFTSVDNNENMLWLALAVANSTFIEEFYDRKFHNKLYSGRRRFITQYVEKFPLPDPFLPLSKEIIKITKKIYKLLPKQSTDQLEQKLDKLVWNVFGF